MAAGKTILDLSVLLDDRFSLLQTSQRAGPPAGQPGVWFLFAAPRSIRQLMFHPNIYMAVSILYPYTKSNKTTIEQTLVFGFF